MLDDIRAGIEDYYSSKIRHHGATPQGVDWGTSAAQQVRFRQLLRLLVTPDGADLGRVSINDLGCGYGALLEHIQSLGLDVDYTGIDLSEPMIAAARARFDGVGRFHVGSKCPGVSHYGLASGLFNVKGDVPVTQWEAFVRETITELDATSSRGFAFNCLTSYSDTDKQRADLYYADPCQWFDWCKRRFSPHVALLHDYGLYDFTLMVRKP